MRFFGSVLVTMLVIMDPPGAVPVFLAVTSKLSPTERRKAAVQAVATAFLVIVLFALGGQQVLRYLKISVDALRGAGGLLLLLVAMQLLRGGSDPHADTLPEQRTSIAMVPLGTPLLAGPGAIVAVILFARDAGTAARWVQLMGAVVTVHLALWLAMRFSSIVLRVIKETGVLLVTRVAGILLAAIAVQMIADAVLGFARQV